MFFKFSLTSVGIIASIFIWSEQTNAQIVPDKTLPSNSQVSSSNKDKLITGGTTAGQNLFHSFKSLSVPSTNTAHFVNSTNIVNIFSRVTGTSISKINGIIKTNGKANLFLINPNGIMFGPSSQLDLGGSFIATTANSIDFLDNKKFGMESIPNRSLLSISQPIGLNINSSKGSIIVNGQGHNLKLLNPENPIGRPIADTPVNITSLQTLPGRTLAFIGGSIQIDGGIISTPSGNLALSSVGQGYVGMSSTSKGLTFDHENVIRFSDISLTNQSLLSSTGFTPGDINIKGRNFNLINGSILITSNYSSNNTSKVGLDLSGNLFVKGSTNPAFLTPRQLSGVVPFGGIITQNFSDGKGSEISILSDNIDISDFGIISTFNYSEGSGGDINTSAYKALSISGSPPIPFAFLPSSITTLTTAGDAGSISVNGKLLNIIDGGYISSNSIDSSTTSLGNSGEINVDFDKVVISSGFPVKFSPDSPISSVPSFIGTTAASLGNAGGINLKANKLYLFDGARINSTSNNQGNAGDINADISDTIVIKGKLSASNDLGRNSQIVSSAEAGTNFFIDLFRIPDLPTGKSGSINISSKSLVIKDEGQITVKNDGPNDAGEIFVNSRFITLNNGKISATTNGGDGGNVQLFGSLAFLNDAVLSASAIKKGKGGNLSANVDLFLALGESRLTAEAEKSQGGNISITAKAALFGPNVDVSVSSDAGLQLKGSFDINVEKTDFGEATTPVPDLKTSPKVVSACNPSTGASKFVAMGPGALQTEPHHPISPDSTWDVTSPQVASKSQSAQTTKGRPMIEATGWKEEKGKVVLIAEKQANSTDISSNPSTCNRS